MSDYPFVDLRPRMLFTQSKWDEMTEEYQRLILREAWFQQVKIEIMPDDAE